MTELTLVTLNHFLNGLGSHESFAENESVWGRAVVETEWGISHSSLTVQAGQPEPATTTS